VKRLASVFIIFLACSLVSAESLKPLKPKMVVQFLPFTCSGVNIDEAGIIETLIQSYVAEIYGAEIYTARSSSLTRQEALPDSQPAEENDKPRADASSSGASGTVPPMSSLDVPSVAPALRPPDYIVSGKIGMKNGMRTLSITMTNAKTGEKVTKNSTHRSASEMALKARSIVEGLIPPEEKQKTVKLADAVPEPFSGSNFSGVWKGGTDGFEQVRFFPGGNAMAVLSSGASMKLSYHIDNNTLEVTQTSPNYARFYHPLPLSVAQQLALHAEPMRWEFSLYDNGNVLRGIKIQTAVVYDGDKVLQYKKGSVSQTEWRRTK
jgi:hypothetical protein